MQLMTVRESVHARKISLYTQILFAMESIQNFDDIVSRQCSVTNRKRVAVVCPADSHTEYVVGRCLKEGIADFLLVCAGECKPEFERLRSMYEGHVEVYLEPTPDDAAYKAVDLVREGQAAVLMKGTLNTDNLLRAILNKEHGLLELGRVLSHITIAQIPSYRKLIVFSDAAVVPRPTLDQFDAILRYTVSASRHMGVSRPDVALINCTEKVNEKFPHTICYEELKKRAEAGEYGDVCLGGPMDVKTACDADSGSIKGITSPVVGNADVLIFPNIESGNVFYKTITLFAKAETAGILCGTTVPVVVASRADSCESKYYSLALACTGILG